jgi:hypothetical protein
MIAELRRKIPGEEFDYQARREVEPFVKNPEGLKVWSKEFFHDVSRRIVLI